MADYDQVTEPELLKTDIIRGYTIKKLVGKGAMSHVYKAVDNKTDKTVAVKVLLPYYARQEQFTARFKREAQTITRLCHPNIVKGYRYGKVGDVFYFIMEFIEGIALDALLRKETVLEERRAAEIIVQIAEALAFAAKHRIIHRDVKPSNIVLANDGTAKLTDFGLARAELESALTSFGLVLGTPCYTSPEQARGDKNLDIRTDIYSLGITFFEMLTSEIPFSEFDAALILTRKITDQIPSPITYNGHLSRSLAFIVCKMCERERQNRYQSPEEVLKDLKLFLSGELRIPARKRVGRKVGIKVGKPITSISKKLKSRSILKLLEKDRFDVMEKTLAKNEVLFYEGEDSDDIYILISGGLEVLKAGRQIAKVTKREEFVGEMSSILNIPRTATVRATKKSVLLKIKSEKFLSFLTAAPEFGYKLYHSLASRLNETTIKLKDAQVKVAMIKENICSINQYLGVK